MNKFARITLVALAALLLGHVVVAQENQPVVKVEPWVCPEGFEGQQLNIFNWATYIGENTVSDFEDLCGVTVTYDVYDSDESMLTRLRQGNPGYDVIVPSDYIVPLMIAEGLLEPLNLDNIPNFKNLSEDLRTSPFDPKSEYALPYLWGTIGIGYNATTVPEVVTSWRQFFEYDGPVAWTDDGRTMITFALLLNGFDPNSADPDEVGIAKDYLISHSDNVVVIAEDDGQEWLVRGEVDMAIEYVGDIYQLALDCECDDYVYVTPEEGTAISAGFIGIPTGAQNHALAEVFLDYILHPQVAADIANFTAYPTPNQAAIDLGLIDEALLNNKGIYPDDEIRAKLFFFQQEPGVEQVYNDAWDEIRIKIGQ